jgi:DNA repair protein RecN (Recombination protein N)
LDEIQDSDTRRAELEAEYQETGKLARKLATALSEKRREAATKFVEQVQNELAFLDMPFVRLVVRQEPCTLNATGCDEIEFLISTNPGEPPKPIARIASGGELSRIMLALKTVLAAGDPTDVLIFDEIDTGISGGISQKVGMKLKAIARGSAQVLCITHAAQIAALADRQYRISKGEQNGRSVTTVTPLAEEDRPAEIARMMGGMEITEILLSGAKELLANSKNL